jgi:hypothetical protein
LDLLLILGDDDRVACAFGTFLAGYVADRQGLLDVQLVAAVSSRRHTHVVDIRLHRLSHVLGELARFVRPNRNAPADVGRCRPPSVKHIAATRVRAGAFLGILVAVVGLAILERDAALRACEPCASHRKE